MHAMTVLAGDLSGPGTYVDIPFTTIQVSVGNLVIIGSMLVVFALAILLPFPKDRHPR